ncbi:hypothetical protein AB9P05_24115 [Roseivirga sp. BDSF3-8]|uniref:hypothetical protein n=1 Tax=Roseivirga sp. BDSF3-8 TaxID=3241598 RepID=UPI00353254BE
MNLTKPAKQVEAPPFASDLTPEDKKTLDSIRAAIMQADPMVDERLGKHMQHKKVLLYEQEGVFKYSLIRTKLYFTFRSAVMYAHPELRRELAETTSFFKVQKGCINFTSLRDFPLDTFSQWMHRTAAIAFMPAATADLSY